MRTAVDSSADQSARILDRLRTAGGFHFPDYRGGSLVNLLSSIIRALGGISPHLGLRALDETTLNGVRRITYLVLDGVGYEQLDRFMGAGGGSHFFSRHPFERITTVFPSTTAAAVTTLSTGATPAEHGLLSWHLHLHDLGLVGAVLPGKTLTGTPLAGSDFNLRRYLGLPSYLSSVRRHKRLLSFGTLGRSPYSNAGTRWNGYGAYNTLRGMERQTARFARQGRPGLAYVYWPLYDTLCHRKGVQARETRRHLAEIDASLGRLTSQLAGTGTLLLVTADHGVVDSPPPKRIDLAAVPGLLDCLAMLPAGDGRQVSCFVRPGRVGRFREVLARHLADACVCITGEELLESGLLGPGQPHPALRSRVGDYVLLARDDYAFQVAASQTKARVHKGNHGGLSSDEVYVPLYALRL
ncbi:MAG: alkaline phosphatase family protein [Deltaproteobacteria bacterium]|nr:alkaline phosphatase family protein [Deltaproteobacteria bacterium]